MLIIVVLKLWLQIYGSCTTACPLFCRFGLLVADEMPGMQPHANPLGITHCQCCIDWQVSHCLSESKNIATYWISLAAPLEFQSVQKRMTRYLLGCWNVKIF